MQWQPLTSRTIHVDWAQRLSVARVDPYLVWADATRFAGFGATPPERISIAFEVDTASRGLAAFGHTFTAAPVCGEAVAIGSRFGVASVRIDGLRWLLDPAAQQVIRRFEIGLPLSSAATGLRAGLLNARGEDVDLGAPDSAVAAVIDDGCPFAHAGLLTNKGGIWHTRIASLWFQEDRKAFGFSAVELDSIIRLSTRSNVIDERACYTGLRDALRKRLPAASTAADQWWQRMMAPATHGAHVLDIFAGSPNPLAARYGLGADKDEAGQARIMFVQLPRDSIEDTSGLSMNVCVLEALAYLQARVKQRRTVVNLSYGSLAGPHDGSSLLESAMDHFLEENPNFSIVLPAGNGYDYLTHASVVAGPDAQWQELPLCILPEDPTDTFIELWYDASASQLDFELIGPDGSHSGAVGCNAAWEAMRPGAKLPSAAIVHQSRPPTATDASKHAVLVALAATRASSPLRPTVAHGVWTVRVRNRGAKDVTIDAWIERDDSAFGSGRSRTQAVFLSRGVEPAPGNPHSATAPVVRRACLNSIAHGERTVVVGGSELRSKQITSYSASGPGRRGRRPGPDYVAPCEESAGVGLLAAGTRSGSMVRMNGTSVATPIAARDLLNRTSRLIGRPEAAADIDTKALLPPDASSSGHTMPDPALRRGAGLLKPFTNAPASVSVPAQHRRARRNRRAPDPSSSG